MGRSLFPCHHYKHVQVRIGLIGGPMAVVGLTGLVIEFHRSGKLRVLAMTAHTRLIAAPEFPTAAESGFPGLAVQGTVGYSLPPADQSHSSSRLRRRPERP